MRAIAGVTTMAAIVAAASNLCINPPVCRAPDPRCFELIIDDGNHKLRRRFLRLFLEWRVRGSNCSSVKHAW